MSVLRWAIWALAGQLAIANASASAESILEEGSLGTTFLPAVAYLPETNWLFGAFNLTFFRFKDTLRQTQIRSVATYSLNANRILRVSPELYFNQDRSRLFLELANVSSPDLFYGFGGGTSASAAEKLINDSTRVFVSYRHRLWKYLEAGPLVELQWDRVSLGGPSNPLLTSGLVRGSTGSNVIGLGTSLSWDERDSTFFPSQGRFYEMTLSFYDPSWGATYRFQRARINLREYVGLSQDPRWVWATQLYYDQAFGDVPLIQTPMMGGSTIMRGYALGRFRGPVVMAAQTELRFPVYWRFSGAAFVGAGNAGLDWSDWWNSGLKPAAGLGTRIRVSDVEKVFARLDFGVGMQGAAFYVQFGEAF